METFSTLLALCTGNSPTTVNSPHRGQWRRALMFSLICAGIKDWVNNREAGDLRRHRGYYDVNVMNKNVLLTLTSMCLYIYIYAYRSICFMYIYMHMYMCYFYFIQLISLSMSETNMKPCIVFWQTVLYQNVALLLVSLHPLLTTIYCEMEIRAHKPRLPALIAMKECYQFFSKQCTLYLLPEHVKMLYWLHVCCFVYWMEIM